MFFNELIFKTLHATYVLCSRSYSIDSCCVSMWRMFMRFILRLWSLPSFFLKKSVIYTIILVQITSIKTPTHFRVNAFWSKIIIVRRSSVQNIMIKWYSDQTVFQSKNINLINSIKPSVLAHMSILM